MKLSLKLNGLASWIIILLITLAISVPLFSKQFFHLHDWTHVARLAEMDQAINDGHFPVRWSKNLGFGYGMPQFNFYAPLFYYLAWVFHFLGFSYIWSVKLVIILNSLVSGIMIYTLVKDWWGEKAGLVAASLYLTAPYRAVDIYVRGALGELTAMTMITVCLWAINHYYKKPSKPALVVMGLALAGLLTAHNLVALISLPLIGVYALALLINQPNRRKLLAGLVGGLGLGLLMASFYVLPMWFEKGFTRVEEITGGFSDYHHHFLYIRQFFQPNWAYGGSISGPNDDISFFLGYGQILLGLVGCLTIIKGDRLKIGILAALGVLAGLMMTYKMEWWWDQIGWLKYVQFPWRYLTWVIIVIGILGGASMRFFNSKSRYWGGLISGLAVITTVILNWNYFKPENYLADNELLYYHNPQRIQTEMSKVIPDFLPRQANPKLTTPPQALIDNTGNDQRFKVIIDRTGEFYVSANLNYPEEIIINQFYFPGWKVWVNGKEWPVKVDDATGLMAVKIDEPLGETAIAGKLTNTPVRTLGNSLTILGLIVGLYLGINKRLYAKS